MTAEDKMNRALIALFIAGLVAIALALWVFWGIASYVLGS